MIALSQKTQYAVRAIYELACRYGSDTVVSIAEIASSQAIPQRFLEGILNQLRQAGFVESRRGPKGGYVLAKSPQEITLGDVIRFMEGPYDIVKCSGHGSSDRCSLEGKCPFNETWEEVGKALAGVLEGITFAKLVAKGVKAGACAYDYAI